MIQDLLGRLNLEGVQSGACHSRWIEDPGGEQLHSINPATGDTLARVVMASSEVYDRVVDEASEAFRAWRTVPPPARGEVVRRIGMALREQKADLGLL